MGQEDGLLMQPSKYFFYTLVISVNLFTWKKFVPILGTDKAPVSRQCSAHYIVVVGRRQPQSETVEVWNVTCCKYYKEDRDRSIGLRRPRST